MLPTLFSDAILRIAGRISNAPLVCDVGNDAQRSFLGSFQKRTQKTNCAELDGKAQTMVVAPAKCDDLLVGVIEVEEACQLFRRWLAGKSPEAIRLIFTEEANGHGRITPAGPPALAKLLRFAKRRRRTCWLDSRLQKYASKGSLIARTFAIVKFGYARVSTLEQNLDLQLKALKKAGCRMIFREKVSGFIRQRPEFQRILDQIGPGDTIVVWKLDRLARSTRDLLNTMETIHEAGGKFQSLSEPWANTTTHVGKVIMTVFAGIAEFERDLIRERTGAGREAAKKRGVRFGRPRKLNAEQVQVAVQLLAQGFVRHRARTFAGVRRTGGGARFGG